MDLDEAYRITKKYQHKSVLTQDEEFMLIEAYKYIIDTCGPVEGEDDCDMPDGYIAMYNLANYYKRKEEYELALKYFELCSRSGGASLADVEIGDIWYYGLTGETDYAKAFKYNSNSSDCVVPKAKIRIADMYRNGEYVQEDYERYCELIFELMAQTGYGPSPLFRGEIFYKGALIFLEEEMYDEAFESLLIAQDSLEKQLAGYTDDSDFDLMKSIIELEFEMMDPEQSESIDFHLYELFHYLTKPVCIEFTSSSGYHYVTSHKEPSGITVELDGKWFRSIDDFFRRATIDGERLPAVNEDLHDFRVL